MEEKVVKRHGSWIRKNEEIVKQIKITGYIHLTLCY